MRVYSRVENIFTNVNDPKLNTINLNQCNFEDDDVFYYDRHDLSIRNIDFDNFIDETHWNHIKNNPNTKIIINFTDDYFNILDIKRFSDTIIEKNINQNQIYFLTMDKNFENFSKTKFYEFGISDINVCNYNLLLKKINFNYIEKVNNERSENNKKFSILSRNYFPWRLSIFLYLIKNNILDHFEYTFNNINPYIKKTFTMDEIKNNVLELGYDLDDDIEKWLLNIPYQIGGSIDKWRVDIYDTIYRNDFHLLIESHLDPYLFNNFNHFKDRYTVKEFSPSFITEKTWKVILCKKPFLIASVPYSLEDLRKLGYKTFSPFIDESYDLIEDNHLRLKAMLNEVNRICNLDENEYLELKNNCQIIAEHNYNILKNEYDTMNFYHNFNFLKNNGIQNRNNRLR